MSLKLKNKRVLVYGLGDSGRSAIKLLTALNAHVFFYDDDINLYNQIGFVRHIEEEFFDLVVISPGVKIIGNPHIENFKKRKIRLISELDLAYSFCKGRIIAVTGANGKTTTCMLINKILKEAGYETFLCGNIGLPFSAICQNTNKKSVTVCEVSSFQLETSTLFRANVACILNIKPDHLDRHESFEEYVRVKSTIASRLRKTDRLILNLDDETSKNLVLHKNYSFFSKNILKKGAFVKNGKIYFNKKAIISTSCIPLKGDKNLENVLASVCCTVGFKIKKDVYEKAISSFTPASHRMELVGKFNEVTYIDDSKATNVASTQACLSAYKEEKTILLLGGRGKEYPYDGIFLQPSNLKLVVCFGEEGKKIYECATKYKVNCEFFSHFYDAVKFACETATKDDFVLLSPACSSFDEFSSYAERGEAFKKYILEFMSEKNI